MSTPPTAPASKRNRLIVIEQRNTGPAALDDHGKRVGWVAFCRPWARVVEATARERNSKSGVVAFRAATFTITYREGITKAMRIGWDGLFWNIKGTAELGFRRELQIVAEVAETTAAT